MPKLDPTQLADWQIADALLVEALNKPPKPGKTEVKKEPKAEAENSVDLFAAAEAAEDADTAKVGQVGPVGQVGLKISAPSPGTLDRFPD